MAWSPHSWRARPIRQQPRYEDSDAVAVALDTLRALPPLVAPGEIDTLRSRLAAVARGDAFLLQGGDCAERFVDCAPGPIERKLKILLQMSLVLTWGARMPVVRVARMGGQYAKPRSRPTERVDGVEVPSYRGDLVNGIGADERRADPERLVQAHFRAAATLNYIRALLDGGFASLRNPRHWDLGFVRSRRRRATYEDTVDRILDALGFASAVGMRGDAALESVELYASHEGLLLPWEEAQTVEVRGRYYNLGAHTLWMGHRTRQLEEAHVEYFRGLANPIGIKVGPGLEGDALVSLLDRVDPDDEPGRITLITRFGADRITQDLPPLVQAVQATGRTVVWACDPMHGNTVTTGTGLKTRDVGDVFTELRHALSLHRELGGHLGGVHIELTGDDVTECTGGPQELSEGDLSRAYETWCDPRLNYYQALEMAFVLAQGLQNLNGAPAPRSGSAPPSGA